MRAFIVICCFLYATAVTASEDCNGLFVDGVYHDKEIIKDNIRYAYQLIVDWKTNTLFFSYNSDEEDVYHQSAYISLDTNTFANIPGITEGFSSTVDQESGKVYLGGRDGIYTFDPITKSAVYFGENGTFILDLFYKEKLYFIKISNHKLYSYENGEANLVNTLENFNITHFAIVGNNEIFGDGELDGGSPWVYSLEQNSNIEDVKRYSSGESYFRGIAIDKEGKVYFSFEDGVYTLDEHKVFRKVATIENHFGVAFDNNNNMIYSAGNKIIKLTRSSKRCTPA